MPTEPHRDILDRERSRVSALPLLEIGSPLLVELLNHASNAFVRVQHHVGDEPDIDLAPLSLYRHVMEMVDVVEVATSQGCAVGCVPAVRSAFEASLSLEFLLQRDFEIRARAWIFHAIRSDVVAMTRFDRATDEGRGLVDAYRAEFGSEPGGAMTPEMEEQRDGLLRVLAEPRFDDARARYDALIEQRRRPGSIWWFQLTDLAPSSIRNLATSLEHLAQYDILYTHWSKIAHAAGFRTLLRDTAFLPIRAPHELQNVLSMASGLQIRATQLLIDHYRHGESLQAWYVREVQEPFNRLNRTEVIVRRCEGRFRPRSQLLGSASPASRAAS